MFDWTFPVYKVNEILDAAKKENTPSGIPPMPVTKLLVFLVGREIHISFTIPEDTFVNNQLVCTLKGVKVIRKEGSAPKHHNDGVLVEDILGETLITKNVEIVDKNIKDGKTYYYGVYPYSDHNAFYLGPGAIKKAEVYDSSKGGIYRFTHNFENLDPETTIDYPTGCVNSSWMPMMTNASNGRITVGSWKPFLDNILKNKPAYIDPETLKLLYWLDPDDYRLKEDGTKSDYDQPAFPFSWINRIYMREEYSKDGTSREVSFSGEEHDGFYPVGFYNQNREVVEGLWLPMAYLYGPTVSTHEANDLAHFVADTKNAAMYLECPEETITVNGVEYPAGQAYHSGDTLNLSMDNFVPFGGPIIHVLRDLEYMLFKTTNVPIKAGIGYGSRVFKGRVCPDNSGEYHFTSDTCSVSGISKIAKTGLNGFYGEDNQPSKMFHSNVLGSYAMAIKDPYVTLMLDDMQHTTYPSVGVRGDFTTKMNVCYSTKPEDMVVMDTEIKRGDGLSGVTALFPSIVIQSNSPMLGSSPSLSYEQRGSNLTGLCDLYHISVYPEAFSDIFGWMPDEEDFESKGALRFKNQIDITNASDPNIDYGPQSCSYGYEFMRGTEEENKAFVTDCYLGIPDVGYNPTEEGDDQNEL